MTRKFCLFALGVLLGCVPMSAQEKQPLGIGFYAVTAANWSAVAFDLATTQSCIDRGICREGNPIMGRTLAQRVVVSSSMASIQTYLSYRERRHGDRTWLLYPTVGLGIHTLAGGFNLRF